MKIFLGDIFRVDVYRRCGPSDNFVVSVHGCIKVSIVQKIGHDILATLWLHDGFTTTTHILR